MPSKLQRNTEAMALLPHLKWVRCRCCCKLFPTVVHKDFVLCRDCGKLSKFKSKISKDSIWELEQILKIYKNEYSSVEGIMRYVEKRLIELKSE